MRFAEKVMFVGGINILLFTVAKSLVWLAMGTTATETVPHMLYVLSAFMTAIAGVFFLIVMALILRTTVPLPDVEEEESAILTVLAFILSFCAFLAHQAGYASGEVTNALLWTQMLLAGLGILAALIA